MIRRTLADGRLLARRTVIATGVVFAVVVGMMVWISRRAAGRQLRIIADGLQGLGLDTVGGPCGVATRQVDVAACLASVPPGADIVFPSSLLDYYPAVVEATDLTTNVSGLLTFAARQAGTMTGLVALALIVAVHVTSPWESGTARWLVPRLGLARMVRTKATTVVGCVLLLPVISYVGALLGSLVPIGFALPPSHTEWTGAATQLAVGWLVLLSTAAVAFGLALWSRTLVGAFITTVGLLAVGFFGTLDPDLYSWSPAGWIATILRLPQGEYRQAVDFLWVPAVSGTSVVTSVIGLLVGSTLICGLGVYFVSKRQPIA